MYGYEDEYVPQATMADAHAEWHRNAGIPMGTPGCPQDACHPTEPDEYAPQDLVCLNAAPECNGPVEYRMALSATGRPFPRCDYHWGVRLDQEQVTRERYPDQQPADFDPYYAGEAWYEEDY